MLICPGFHRKWMEWINGCIHEPKFQSSSTEGQELISMPQEESTKVTPLSRFLFLIVSEVLVVFISWIHENGMFEGFLVGKDKIHLSILQFADNTLLFCKNDNNMLNTPIQTIGFFEWYSGAESKLGEVSFMWNCYGLLFEM